jgi:hypothetical protein
LESRRWSGPRLSGQNISSHLGAVQQPECPSFELRLPCQHWKANFIVCHFYLSPVIGAINTHCSTPQIMTIILPRIVIVVINIRTCFVFLQ